MISSLSRAMAPFHLTTRCCTAWPVLVWALSRQPGFALSASACSWLAWQEHKLDASSSREMVLICGLRSLPRMPARLANSIPHPSGLAGIAACPWPHVIHHSFCLHHCSQQPPPIQHTVAHPYLCVLQIDYLLRLLAPLARTFGAGDLPPTLCAALQRGSAEDVFAAGPAAGWVPCLHPMGLREAL